MAGVNNDWLESAYQGILGRSAQQAGLDYWGNEVASGKMTQDQVRSALANSAEGQNYSKSQQPLSTSQVSAYNNAIQNKATGESNQGLLSGVLNLAPTIAPAAPSVSDTYVSRPNMKQFMDATGVDSRTASNALYGMVGSYDDNRDWGKIMQSSDPVAAAIAGVGQVYQSDSTKARDEYKLNKLSASDQGNPWAEADYSVPGFVSTDGGQTYRMATASGLPAGPYIRSNEIDVPSLVSQGYTPAQIVTMQQKGTAPSTPVKKTLTSAPSTPVKKTTTPTEDTLNTRYQGLFGRDVKQEGLDYWLKDEAYLNADDAGRNALLTGGVQAGTRDAKHLDAKSELNDNYQGLFGRDVKQEGLDYWLKDEPYLNATDDQRLDMLAGGAQQTDATTLLDKIFADAGIDKEQNQDLYNQFANPSNSVASSTTLAKNVRDAAQKTTTPANTVPANTVPADTAAQYVRPEINEGVSTPSAMDAIDNVLNFNHPVMQRAMAKALQIANSRGLLNSSMATEAVMAAVVDQAKQIAAMDLEHAQNLELMGVQQGYDIEKLNATHALDVDTLYKQHDITLAELDAQYGHNYSIQELINASALERTNITESMKKYGYDIAMQESVMTQLTGLEKSYMNELLAIDQTNWEGVEGDGVDAATAKQNRADYLTSKYQAMKDSITQTINNLTGKDWGA